MTPENENQSYKVPREKRPKHKILTKQVRFFLSPSDYQMLLKAVEIDNRTTPAKFCRLYIMRMVNGLIMQNSMPQVSSMMSAIMKEIGDKEHPDLFK